MRNFDAEEQRYEDEEQIKYIHAYKVHPCLYGKKARTKV